MMNDQPDAAKVGMGSGQLWLVTAVLYFSAAVAVIHLTSDGRDLATIWPSNAILLAVLLADDRPRWGTVLSAGFVADVAANLIVRGTLVGPIFYGVANLVEVGLAVRLLRKAGGDDDILHSTAAMCRFLLVAGLLAPAVSGLVGGLTAFLVFGEPLPRSFRSWVASDGLGLLVFTPFFFALFRGDFIACFKRRTGRQRIESVALLTLTGAVAAAIFFGTERPLLFAIFPPLMLVTLRIGRPGAEAAVMVVAIIGGIATMHGRGPVMMIASDPASQAQAFQVFLAVLLLTCLPFAAEVAARARLTAALEAHDREMTTRAHTDALTGLLNRRGFETEAGHLLPGGVAAPFSVIAIDFDHFKQINDRWGHQAGDKALRHLASMLSFHVRAGDLVARLGGDEFMILLRDSGLDHARAVCERIRTGVHASPLAIDGRSVAFLSLSMGIASFRPDEDYERLMQRADRALYDAKEAGRNTVRWAA